MHHKGLLTVAQAALLLGWSRWTVVRQLKGGLLDGAGSKLEGDTSPWLIDRAAVEKIVAERDEKRAAERQLVPAPNADVPDVVKLPKRRAS
jgi:hypothetical protein